MKRPFDHFDLIARYYDRLIGRPAQDPLPELVAAEPGQLLLDVGGGTGRNSRGMALDGARVVVCDSSLEMARQAQRKGLPAVVGDATHLPFATDGVDRVLVVDAFHHFVYPSAATAQAAAAPELLRVLKPGGRLVVEEPDIRHAGVKLIAVMETLLVMRSRFLLPDDLRSLFEAAGARTLTVHDHGFSTQLVLTSDGAAAGRGGAMTGIDPRSGAERLR